MKGMKVSLTPCFCSKPAALALAQADDAGHVDFVDGVDVGAMATLSDHALGDDGAHAAEGDHLPVRGHLRRAAAARRSGFAAGAGAAGPVPCC